MELKSLNEKLECCLRDYKVSPNLVIFLNKIKNSQANKNKQLLLQQVIILSLCKKNGTF